MNNFEVLGKFINYVSKSELTNLSTLLSLKDDALMLWKNGLLSDSEHCTIESWLDNLISGLNKVDLITLAYFLSTIKLSNDDQNRLLNLVHKAGREDLFNTSFTDVKEEIFKLLEKEVHN